MPEPPETLEGWYALHDLRTIDWAAWRSLSATERTTAITEATECLSELATVEQANGTSSFYRILGHKADLLFLHLRPSLEELSSVQTSLDRTQLGACLTKSYGYISITELSLYEAYARAGGDKSIEEIRELPFAQQRLFPAVPDMPYISFYPMSKRRGETNNWYAADMDERRRMMREHGSTGRKYHGQVQQMITGSTGLDDWEWGVTLFATDPLHLKKLVYEMRFDEVTAKYAEFGQFYTGIRIDANAVGDLLHIP
jgi:chlorite dismutase